MDNSLDVAASMARLLSGFGQVCSVLKTFICSVRNALSSARDIFSEVDSFHTEFSAWFTLFTSTRLTFEAALISVRNMMSSIIDAVLLFSEIESVILPLARSTKLNSIHRILWMQQRSRVLSLIGRLQWQKSSISLQLNILAW